MKLYLFYGKQPEINRNNSALQLDVQNAEYYQIAFNDFLDMDWRKAITNLEIIIQVDKNFAGGNARILLFKFITSWQNNIMTQVFTRMR